MQIPAFIRIICLWAVTLTLAFHCSSPSRAELEKLRPESLSLYPDEDPVGDRTGVYYSREKLNAALAHSHEPYQIQQIHNELMAFDIWMERTARNY